MQAGGLHTSGSHLYEPVVTMPAARQVASGEGEYSSLWLARGGGGFLWDSGSSWEMRCSLQLGSNEARQPQLLAVRHTCGHGGRCQQHGESQVPHGGSRAATTKRPLGWNGSCRWRSLVGGACRTAKTRDRAGEPSRRGEGV